jgi:predicted ATPase
MPTVIRTPDQRLRVFVSSTLGEVARERVVVRAAIERLRLTPVMFEQGARPHPPRQLYRSYLEQSDVFVGIYARRYGWIAPGETVSGLEDEYRLAGERPRLLYIKDEHVVRDHRLEQLLESIRDDDRVSYKHFVDAEDLASLVADDLALLLSERFESSAVPPTQRSQGTVPLPLTETVGRDGDIEAIVECLRDGARLVVLTGPGGVGKTRLAIEAVHRMRAEHGVTTHFVALANVRRGEEIAGAIVDAVRAREDGAASQDARDVLMRVFSERAAVVLLDNVEQIVGAASAISDLAARNPTLRLLVTSRHALRIRGEFQRAVEPLALPRHDMTLTELLEQPCIRLFVERARTSTTDFALTHENARHVVDIVRRVDGLPLAIELLAAHARMLPLDALLDRFPPSLGPVTVGWADLPERQQSMRATLDWSYGLLAPTERAVFAQLSVFADGWTLLAAEHVCGGPDTADVLATVASLLDKNLIVLEQGERAREPRLRMLETVRAYALHQLHARGQTHCVEMRYLDWYCRLGAQAMPFLCGPDQRGWIARMGLERANLRSAVDVALACRDLPAVINLAWDIIVLYFVEDAVHEPDQWLRAVASARPELDEVSDAKLRSLLALTRMHHGDYRDVHASLLGPRDVFRRRGMVFEQAVVLHQLGFVLFHIDGLVEPAEEALRESAALFESLDHDWGVSLAEAMLASVLASTGSFVEAEASQRRALAHARRIDSDQQVAQALTQFALLRLRQNRIDSALGALAEAIPLVVRGQYRTDGTYVLDGLAHVALARHDYPLAARAAAIADKERRHLGVQPWPTTQLFIDELQQALQHHATASTPVSAVNEPTCDLFDELPRMLAHVSSSLSASP